MVKRKQSSLEQVKGILSGGPVDRKNSQREGSLAALAV